MGDSPRGDNQGQKIKQDLREILVVAAEFERTARDFYTNLIPRVSSTIRYLVEELAEEERQHCELFSHLAENLDIARKLASEVELPESNADFVAAVSLPDLGETPKDKDVISYALAREEIAMQQYRALAEKTEPGPVKELFGYLANEEAKHKNQLELKYRSLLSD